MSELRNETTVKSFEQLVPEFKNMLAYFRVYPDKFLDYISDSTTKNQAISLSENMVKSYFQISYDLHYRNSW